VNQTVFNIVYCTGGLVVLGLCVHYGIRFVLRRWPGSGGWQKTGVVLLALAIAVLWPFVAFFGVLGGVVALPIWLGMRGKRPEPLSPKTTSVEEQVRIDLLYARQAEEAGMPASAAVFRQQAEERRRDAGMPPIGTN
jgi:hypothetical protein